MLKINYLEQNKKYWERGYKGYPDENIESFIFRPYGRIIEEYYQKGSMLQDNRKMLDFGCGSGQPLVFFKSNTCFFDFINV